MVIWIIGKSSSGKTFIGKKLFKILSKKSKCFLVDGDNVTVGISDYAQGELGDIVFVTLPEVGQEFNKGDAIVEVEATKTVAEAYAPMNCVITEVNSTLETEPELINNDPVGEGWMVKAEIKEMDDSGMSYQQYESFIS